MKSYSKAGAAAKTAAAPKKKGVKTEEANEVAGFLLSLKNQRSVSPDPNDAPDATNTVVEEASAPSTAKTASDSTTGTAPTTATGTVPIATSTDTATPAVVALEVATTTTTTAAAAAAAAAESSSGVITGYAGPPPELTAFPGIPVVYPAASSYPYPPVHIPGAMMSPLTTTQKKVYGKEKKLKKSLESGVVATEDLASLQAMIDQFETYDLTKFVDESNPLVQYKDRDLVPDSLFVAMLQMKVCYLTQSDRVGCYKTRDLGFVGMCCKHCNGQPGFGRYFPNSVRSLAQTTTSQTILKHIASKCRFCPPNIRDVVVELIRQQTIREAAAAAMTSHTIQNVIASADTVTSSNNQAAASRPRYGSRKIFFHRVWSRLHAGTLGITTTDEDMDDYNDGDGDNYISSSVIDDVVQEAMGASVAVAAAVETKEHPDEDAAAASAMASTNKRTLPLVGKNKKQKVEGEDFAAV